MVLVWVTCSSCERHASLTGSATAEYCPQNSVARCYTQDVDVQYVLPFIMQYIQAADPYQLRLVPQKGKLVV